MNKKNHLLLCVAVFLMLSVMIFSTFLSDHPSSKLTTVTEKTGNTSITSYVDAAGKRTVASDKGYASVVKEIDGEGNVILESYLDADGCPVTLRAGYSSISRSYDDGLATVIMYQDESGRPTVINKGYSTIHRTYNDKRRAETDTYYIIAGGVETQVARPAGYWQYRRSYTGKYVTEIHYLDQDGAPVNTTSGYSTIARVYDPELGTIREERYYDSDGLPAARVSDGSYGCRKEYDSQGRVVMTVYLGPEGEPKNVKKGYSTIVTSYLQESSPDVTEDEDREAESDDGSEEDTVAVRREYFDAEGNRTTIGRFQYGTLTDSDGMSVYLDKNGEPMWRLDHFLFTHPVFVLAVALLLTVTAVYVKGRKRTAYLILFILLILYMTVMLRESGDSKSRLEPFFSYRQFMRSRSVRLGILNNIWLFVPFGTVLGNLVREAGSSADGNRLRWLILAPFLFSVLIESVQYFTGIGLCETDDVISNTLGGLLGYGIAYAAHRSKMLNCSHKFDTII